MIYCESGRIGPYFLDFSANRTTMHLQIEKIWPRFPTFSLRSFLPRRLLARRYLQACLVLYRIRGSPSLSEPCAKGMKTELDRGSEPGIHRWAPGCKGRNGGFPGTELRWSQETRSNGGHECPLPAGTKLSFLFPVFLKESRELRRSRLPYFSCRHRQRHLGGCPRTRY